MIRFGLSNNKFLFAVATMSFVFFASCEKRTERSFLNNVTEFGVTVEYGFEPWKESPTSVYVGPGEVVEIPDVDRWGLVHPANQDSVIFLFDDGVRVVHYYENGIDSLSLGHEQYVPEVNNIMADFLSPNPSWKEKNTSGNKWRNDYYIRR